uniref:Uncharacterized protein n=1 Tax=Arundo donax TaxID=35708 RepID=A0A0A8ZJK9_ARUDO
MCNASSDGIARAGLSLLITHLVQSLIGNWGCFEVRSGGGPIYTL